MPHFRNQELTGWRQQLHLKLRFGLAKLPCFPAVYRLRTPGFADFAFRWTLVMPFMDPVRGAFDFTLYGWDVRELRFLRRFLQPGMTVLDIGAHHGLYAILASHLVGSTGRVFAFEPSPRITRRLRWHLALNGARQVEVEPCAVAASKSRMELFIPTRGVDTIASLRLPQLSQGRARSVMVDVVALDDFIAARQVASIDLIKLDVEGAEMDVLAGAREVMQRTKPCWLFEALDSTAESWGNSGRTLVDRFAALGHTLFEFTPDGMLQPHAPRVAYPLDSNCNLLAVPGQKLALVEPLLAPGPAP
jgi:FkbM family methyltransferase